MLNNNLVQPKQTEYTLSGIALFTFGWSIALSIACAPIIMLAMKDTIMVYMHMFQFGGSYEETKKSYEEYKIQKAKNPPKPVSYEDLDPLAQYMLNDLMGDMPQIHHDAQ